MAAEKPRAVKQVLNLLSCLLSLLQTVCRLGLKSCQTDPLIPAPSCSEAVSGALVLAVPASSPDLQNISCPFKAQAAFFTETMLTHEMEEEVEDRLGGSKEDRGVCELLWQQPPLHLCSPLRGRE